MNNISPIYISGLYRSGTTLIADIFGNHSEVSITYGTVHFMRNSYNKYNPIEINYENLVNDTYKRIKNKWNLKFDSEKVIKNIKDNSKISQALVYDKLMREFLKINDNQVWGEKTNVEWEGIDSFLNLFPNGKVVHIIRDPRAVLASFKYFTFHPEPMYLDAIFAASAMFNYINNINNKNVYIIKYEDLVSNPESIVKRLCIFLNIEFENGMLDITKESKQDKPYSANSSFNKKIQKIDSSNINLWEDKLSNIELYFCNYILKDHIKSYNYKQLDTKLTDLELNKFENLLKNIYIEPRIKYWQKFKTGIQAFPENGYKYSLQYN